MKVKVLNSSNAMGLAYVEILEGMHTGKVVLMRFQDSTTPMYIDEVVETTSVITDNNNEEYVTFFSK